VNLENQVCSLELSKRLKELGVKQDSFWVWISVIKTGFDFLKRREDFEPDSKDIGAFNYPAFTVAELNEIIFQKNYDLLEETGYLNITTEMIDRSCGYYYRLTNNFRENIIDDFNLANCFATLLIYLMECDLL
jgi:hypothetical protein